MDYLLPGHTKPIVGKEEINSVLTIYRDAIQYIHDQTVRVMNKGKYETKYIDKFINNSIYTSSL